MSAVDLPFVAVATRSRTQRVLCHNSVFSRTAYTADHSFHQASIVYCIPTLLSTVHLTNAFVLVCSVSSAHVESLHIYYSSMLPVVTLFSYLPLLAVGCTGRNINTGPISNLSCLELARMMSLKIGHIVCNSFNFHNIYCKSKIFYGCRLQSLQTSEVEFLAYGALKWSRSVIVKELKKLNFCCWTLHCISCVAKPQQRRH